MDEIINTLKNRLNSPILGYYTLALIALNWQSFFYLFAQTGDVVLRIEYFEKHTDTYSIYVNPILLSLSILVTHPWLNYLINSITTKAYEKNNILKLKSENEILQVKKELEKTNEEYLAFKENALIERAKRDQEVGSILSDEQKAAIKSELDRLRYESGETAGADQKVNYNSLMQLANHHRTIAKESTSVIEQIKHTNRAKQLEDKAYELIQK